MYTYIHIHIYLSFYLSIHPSVNPPTQPSIQPSIYIHICVYVYVCLYVCIHAHILCACYIITIVNLSNLCVSDMGLVCVNICKYVARICSPDKRNPYPAPRPRRSTPAAQESDAGGTGATRTTELTWQLTPPAWRYCPLLTERPPTLPIFAYIIALTHHSGCFRRREKKVHALSG